MKPAAPANHDPGAMLALRDEIVSSPVSVALERARAFTRVWRANEDAPWIVRKALALREHLRTVPLYIRPHDRIAGSICETPGAMPVFVELGIAENNIYLSEYPHRRGYLTGQVPPEIVEYWEDRNLWGRFRARMRTDEGVTIERGQAADYKFISNQGHLSPSYRELLSVGLGGLLGRVRDRRAGEGGPDGLEFLTAAEEGLLGVSEWIGRYAEFLSAEARRCGDSRRAADLAEMARIAAKVSLQPPRTFREAMQLVWFVHQAIHIEGHGYSNAPDRLDQLLYPFYQADRRAGRLDDDEALGLCENFLLKQRDNTFWGVEHNLTQGLCVGGSSPDGQDQTNELSWLFITACGNLSLPEPLVWVRWHANIDGEFFDHCLCNLAGTTCFPLMMSDSAVPSMLMRLGVSREDAFNYVPAGCNELAVPGQAYFNPAAGVDYLSALEAAMTGGRGYDGRRPARPDIPPPAELRSFEDLVAAVAGVMRRQVTDSHAWGRKVLAAQMCWGQTPLTSCFFDGCIDRARDMTAGTKYNILSCGGVFFANMVDCLAALREVVYEKRQAGLEEVASACAADFAGREDLRRKLLAAPKHGCDSPALRDLVRLVERLRDEPVKELCRDPRDGSAFGNSHVVRSGAVTRGRVTGATPDGRLAGEPLAASVAAAVGAERKGPTAVLNSVLMMDAVESWQCGYNVNLRFSRPVLTDPDARRKVQAMLASFFARGGQEMQINCADSEVLRAAQREPGHYRDLVVRVAGFSEYFANLRRDMQDEIIARTEHGLQEEC